MKKKSHNTHSPIAPDTQLLTPGGSEKTQNEMKVFDGFYVMRTAPQTIIFHRRIWERTKGSFHCMRWFECMLSNI